MEEKKREHVDIYVINRGNKKEKTTELQQWKKSKKMTFFPIRN